MIARLLPVVNRGFHSFARLRRALPLCLRKSGTLSGQAPNGMDLGFGSQTPDRKSGMGQPYYTAHPLRLRVEIGVAEKAANERGHFILANAHHNQAVATMPEVRQIETSIAGEERDTALPAQENDNFLVLQALPANIDSNLSGGEPRCFQ
jgi:hypothetical protein